MKLYVNKHFILSLLTSADLSNLSWSHFDFLTCTPMEFKTRTGAFFRWLSNKKEGSLLPVGIRNNFFVVFGNPLLNYRNLPAVH